MKRRREDPPPGRCRPELLAANGTTLTYLPGIGPPSAARLLVEVGDITRFPDRDHFASWNGAPRSMPPPVIRSATGCRVPGTGRSTVCCTHCRSAAAQSHRGTRLLRPRKADGKTSMEAIRALKRRLSNIVYKTMLDDAIAHATTGARTGPGGQRGNDSDSSAAGSQPHTGSSDKPLPGPATTDPRTPLPAAS